MSGIIHNMEKKIEHKITEVLHIGHKEVDKHHGDEHKPDERQVENGGHGEQLKEIMHKIKKKMHGHGDGRGHGHGKKKHDGECHHHEEGEECEEGEVEKEASESECEKEEEGGELEFDFQYIMFLFGFHFLNFFELIFNHHVMGPTNFQSYIL